MNLQNKKIAFLGDSITEGVGASTYEKCYVERLKKIAHLDEAFNYGISGTRIAPQKNPSVNSEWDKDFLSRVAQMEDDVDAVVVFGGTNDFGHGDAPIGDFGDVTTDTFYGACYTLMKMLIEKYPDKPILFITPLHRFTENDMINEIGLKRVALVDYVEAIKKTAARFSIPVLDLYSISGMQPNIEVQNLKYFADGLHPNDNGHERIAKFIKAFSETIPE